MWSDGCTCIFILAHVEISLHDQCDSQTQVCENQHLLHCIQTQSCSQNLCRNILKQYCNSTYQVELWSLKFEVYLFINTKQVKNWILYIYLHNEYSKITQNITT